jgi:hypothetical protein
VPESIKRKKPWKRRTLLKEIIMSDGFKLTFWVYEWNDDVALRLGHSSCIRILKHNPAGRFLLTEQIGIRVDNWSKFIDELNSLQIGS